MGHSYLRPVGIGLYLTWGVAFVWIVGWAWVIWASETPSKDLREDAVERILLRLEELVQKANTPAVPTPPDKLVSQPSGTELDKLLNDLKVAVGTNLSIKDHTERTANWALWTVQVMGGIAFVSFVASALGGYAFLQSHKEQTELSNNATRLQKDVEILRNETMNLRDNAKQTVEAMNDGAKKMTILINGYTSWNENNLSNFQKIFASFDFSGLDDVVGPLWIREETILPREEELRIEDFDLQIQVGEVFGAAIDPSIYVKLGRYYSYKKDYHRAIIRFDDALKRNSGIFDAWGSKSISLGRLLKDEKILEKRDSLIQSVEQCIAAMEPLWTKNSCCATSTW